MLVLPIFTIFMMVCTLICASWMRSGKGEKDPSFHAKLSVSTLMFCALTIMLYLFDIDIGF